MQTLTQNITPRPAAPGNSAAESRPAPVDRRHTSPRGAQQLAATFKACVNSSLSIEALEALGPSRLEQLLSNVDTTRLPANGPAPDDEFAGYSINAMMNASEDEGEVLRAASVFQTTVRGASPVSLAALGLETLQLWQAQVEKAIAATSAGEANVAGSPRGADEFAGYSINDLLDKK